MWIIYWINNPTDEIGGGDIATTKEELRKNNLEYFDWEEDALGLHAEPENFPDHSFFIEQCKDGFSPEDIDFQLLCEDLYETRDERLNHLQ